MKEQMQHSKMYRVVLISCVLISITLIGLVLLLREEVPSANNKPHPILDAIEAGDIQRTIDLLSSGAKLKNELEQAQDTYFTGNVGSAEDLKVISFAKDNNIGAVSLMLNPSLHDGKLINLNIHDSNGNTALSWALHHKNTQMVRILLENGADAQYDLIKLLYESGSIDKPMIKAFIEAFCSQEKISNENLKVMDFFFSNGFDVNADISPIEGVSGDDRPPLLWAAFRGSAEVVELLLKYGAKTDAIYDNVPFAKQNLAYLAARHRDDNARILKTLLDKGILTVTSKAKGSGLLFKEGDSMLFTAVNNDKPNIVMLLIERGADTSRVVSAIKKKYGSLDKALISLLDAQAPLRTIPIYLALGANVDAVDENGNTLLLGFIEQSKTFDPRNEFVIGVIAKEIKVLLDNKASVTHKNNAGKSAMDLIKDTKVPQKIRLLIQTASQG